jgi:hypothetical protein
VVNSTRETQRSAIAWGPQHGCPVLGAPHWTAPDVELGRKEIAVPARDALVIALED